MMKRLMVVPVLVLMAMAVFAQAKPRLGILPFTGGSVRDGDTMANFFANSRDLQQEFEIVLRTSSIDSIMREQRFQRSGLTDSDTIADLGKQMNAEYVVSGHIASLGSANLLLISIVDVRTMQQTAGDYREYGRIEDVPSLLPAMAESIIASTRGQSGPSGAALAVLPLNIQDTTVQQGDAEILARILATDIANGHKYAVFPRTSTIETVMAEREFQNSAMTDRATMIKIGEATNAQYVLAGTITNLGRLNMFDVKILNIESGALVEGGGSARNYADLADGIELMSELATDITGEEVGRYGAGRARERQTQADQQAEAERLRDEETRRLEAERKRQDAENFKKGLNEFFFGEKRFTSIGANLGLGFGSAGESGQISNEYGYESREGQEPSLSFNMFGNISVTIPLVWTLFVEAGIDIGFYGSILTDGSGGHGDYGYEADIPDDGKYSAVRPYGRLNIGIPFGDRDFLAMPYAGVGYGSMSASYEYTAYIPGHSEYEYNEYGQPIGNNWIAAREETKTETLSYGGMDLAFGIYVAWGHHGLRFAVNLNNLTEEKNFEVQTILGYAFRF
jgi:TolB-like protein